MISDSVSDILINSADYVAPEVTSEIYVGFIASMVPIVWATYEFTSRLQIQRQCVVCNGTGLTKLMRSGSILERPRKCWCCGGFMPWLGWEAFLRSTKYIGNGGVLQRPIDNFKAVNEEMREKIADFPDIDTDPETQS